MDELIKALRCCAEPERWTCNGCPKCTQDTNAAECALKVNADAADAIETLQAENARMTEEKAKHETHLINQMQEYKTKYNNLLDENAELRRKYEAAVEDIKLIAGDSNGALKCNCCLYNPTDMGCELDGSQFDDAECHFTYRGDGGTK